LGAFLDGGGAEYGSADAGEDQGGGCYAAGCHGGAGVMGRNGSVDGFVLWEHDEGGGGGAGARWKKGLEGRERCFVAWSACRNI